MITKIDNGIVTVSAYGFSPGTYPIEEFTADDLVKERNKLHIKMQYERKVSPTQEEINEIKEIEKLIEEVSILIDQKFDKNGKEIKT